MKLEILIYPNKKLRKISQKVKIFDQKLHELLDDMYVTIEDQENAIGLAAIQVGIELRVIVLNIPDETTEYQKIKENTLEIINPVIIEKNGLEKSQEGCLSVPGVYEDVERAKHVKVEYFDRNGDKHTIEDDDFLAIAIQHEIDHLDGKVFIEKLSYIKRKKFEKEWKRKQKEGLV